MVRFTIRKGKPDFVTVVVGSVLNLTFESEEAAVSWLDLVAREIGAVQLH